MQRKYEKELEILRRAGRMKTENKKRKLQERAENMN